MTAEQVSMVIKLLEPYTVLSASLTSQFINQRGGEQKPAMPVTPPADAVKARKISNIAEEKTNG